MTSFIITGKNSEANEHRAKELCLEKKIDPFDITIITSEKDSVGIEIVKKLQEKVFLMPLRGKDKAVIIPDAQMLTIPAQNALLKLLEEPPAHTYLYLLTNKLESLLGTIKSRCQILKIDERSTEINEDEETLLQDQLERWFSQDIAGALKSAENLNKDKEQALITLEQSLRIGQELLHSSKGDATLLSKRLELISETHRTLSATNTNPRLTLEHLFLSLITL